MTDLLFTLSNGVLRLAAGLCHNLLLRRLPHDRVIHQEEDNPCCAGSAQNPALLLALEQAITPDTSYLLLRYTPTRSWIMPQPSASSITT
jgi:hypothetical protein